MARIVRHPFCTKTGGEIPQGVVDPDGRVLAMLAARSGPVRGKGAATDDLAQKNVGENE
jgi:hypothetical protein